MCHNSAGVLDSSSVSQCQCFEYSAEIENSNIYKINIIFISRLICLLGEPFVSHNFNKITTSSRSCHKQSRELAERIMVNSAIIFVPF